MIKNVVSVLVLMGCLQTANAVSNYMTIEKNTGEKISFLLADVPVVTFEGEELVVNGNAQTSYAVSGVKNYHFTESDQTGIVKTMADVVCIVALDDANIEVWNAPTSVIVKLFNAEGSLVSSSKVQDGGRTIVGLPNQKGVYIISVGNRSFKFIRK